MPWFFFHLQIVVPFNQVFYLVRSGHMKFFCTFVLQVAICYQFSDVAFWKEGTTNHVSLLCFPHISTCEPLALHNNKPNLSFYLMNKFCQYIQSSSVCQLLLSLKHIKRRNKHDSLKRTSFRCCWQHWDICDHMILDFDTNNVWQEGQLKCHQPESILIANCNTWKFQTWWMLNLQIYIGFVLKESSYSGSNLANEKDHCPQYNNDPHHSAKKRHLFCGSFFQKKFLSKRQAVWWPFLSTTSYPWTQENWLSLGNKTNRTPPGFVPIKDISNPMECCVADKLIKAKNFWFFVFLQFLDSLRWNLSFWWRF